MVGSSLRSLLFVAILLSVLPMAFGSKPFAAPTQSSLAELDTKLKSQYAIIEQLIAAPPARIDHPNDYKTALRRWQDRLATSFSEAANTVEEISKIEIGNSEMWRERGETLRLYSQPISHPAQRTVFGPGEVQRRARVLKAPAAIYTDAARANSVKGEVRLRLVMAADGTVRNVFPIKSLSHGLTEFEPATRDNQPASQFVTLVYEFNKNDAKPYIPITVF